jgi:MFS family permease
MMGAAIIVLALIPSYAQIGVAAPILAVTARLVQGFSLGGEVGPTTAYLLEAAPVHRRGLAVSWQGASQGLSAALGGFIGFGLSNLLPAASLDAYGWRIAFLLGAVTLPFGLGCGAPCRRRCMRRSRPPFRPRAPSGRSRRRRSAPGWRWCAIPAASSSWRSSCSRPAQSAPTSSTT